MEKIIKNLAVGLLILIILAPLGLLAVGETFGEWGNKEIEEKLGFIPAGLESLSSLWRAPIPDYAFSGDESQSGMVLAYYLSAILGAVICGGLLYFAGKKIAKN